MEHADRALGTDLSTWSERGWCRMERMARELSSGNSNMISIESPSLQTYEPAWQAAFFPPGEGRFSSQGDRVKVAAILKQLFAAKLFDCLAKEDLSSYRFWLNQQRMRFSGFDIPDSEVAAVLKRLIAAKLVQCQEQEDSVAYRFWLNQQQMRFDTKGIEEKFGEDEKEAAVLARFLNENSFTHATERDAAGWSPLCYAAMNGDPLLVSALLSACADANDRITKGRPECQIQKGMPALQLSAYCRNCDVMKLLLSARAAVNDTDCRGATALHWAMISNTVQGVRILCEAGSFVAFAFRVLTPNWPLADVGSASPPRPPWRALRLARQTHFKSCWRKGSEVPLVQKAVITKLVIVVMLAILAIILIEPNGKK
ncbi:MIB2 [Symbiodinium sp. CCMP2592]|nr:MIB2 [Symbiodinium sp. CCMP2592]